MESRKPGTGLRGGRLIGLVGSILLGIGVIGGVAYYAGSRYLDPWQPKTDNPFAPPEAPLAINSWVPPREMPKPREILKGAEWTRRLGDLSGSVSLKALEQDTRPSFSVEIIQVHKGTQAEKLGISAGDRITAFDGKPVLGYREFNAARGEEEGTLTLWTTAGKMRDVQVVRGRIGINFKDTWEPRLAYVRSRERDGAWDSLVLAAATAWRSDVEAAETALFHAHEAGYRGWLLPTLMARISLGSGRFRQCLDYGWMVRDDVPREQARGLLEDMVNAAVAARQMGVAGALLRKHDDYFLIPQYWNRVEAERTYASLSPEDATPRGVVGEARAGKGEYLPLTGRNAAGRSIADVLAQGGRKFIGASLTETVLADFGPTGRDASFMMEVDFKLINEFDSRFASGIVFRVFDVYAGGEQFLLEMLYVPGVGVSVMGMTLPKIVLWGNRFDRPGPDRIELAVKGRWCEAVINGHRACLEVMPDNRDREVSLSVEFINVAGNVLHGQFRRLDTDATPPVPKASPPAPVTDLKVPPTPSDDELRWFHDVLVGGYLKNGDRSADWDQDALNGIAWTYPLLAGSGNPTRAWEGYQAIRSALDRGCRDPVVLLLAGAAFLNVISAGGGDSTRLFHDAGLALRNHPGYSATIRALILKAYVKMVQKAEDEATREKAVRFAEECLSLLPEAAGEEGPPPYLIKRITSEIILSLKDAKSDPPAALERVESALKAGGAAKGVVEAVRGRFYIDWAWLVRGSDWAHKVPAQAMNRFQKHLETAARELGRAHELDPRCPFAPTEMLTVALGHPPTSAMVAEWFAIARKVDPNNTEACRRMLTFLLPRWHGREGQLVAFGRHCHDRMVKEGLHAEMGVILISAHAMTTWRVDLNEKEQLKREWAMAEYWRNPAVWNEIKTVLVRILTKHPDSVYYRSMYAAYASKCQKWGEAWKQFEILGDDFATAPFGGRFFARRAHDLAQLQGSPRGRKR